MRVIPILDAPPEVFSKSFNHYRSTVVGTSVAPLMTWMNIRSIKVKYVEGVMACNPTLVTVKETEDYVPTMYKEIRMTVARAIVAILAASGLQGMELDLSEDDIKSMRESYLALEEPEEEEDPERTGADDYAENIVLTAISQLLPIQGRDYDIEQIKAGTGDGDSINTSVKIVGRTLVGTKFAEAVNELLPAAFDKLTKRKKKDD